MHEKPKILRQDKKALIISYLAYRVWLAILTYGVLAVYDFLSYKNSKLRVYDMSVELTKGLSSRVTVLGFGDITAFDVSQSGLGRSANYGTIKIHSKAGEVVSLKFVRDPSKIAEILHKRVSAANPTVLTVAQYAEKVAKDAKEAVASRYTGKCPRCDSDRLQPIIETRTTGVSAINSTAGCCCFGPVGLLCGLPGAGNSYSTTKRMCMNCGKKF